MEENVITIDANKFSHKIMQNFISFPQSVDSNQAFNSSLYFYYLESQKETKGYELYDGEGYLGFTPSSWNDDMGIFKMFKTID